MSVSDSAAFASLASTASNYLVRHIMSIICDVWSALPRQPCPPAPPPLTAVAHWSIRNLFEVWKRSANSWNWNWSWCSGCGWGWGCRDENAEADEDDEPKRVVSSLCSFFGCSLLRKCLPTFGFIINFKKLLMAATRCPKMAECPPPLHFPWQRLIRRFVCVWPELSLSSPHLPFHCPCSAGWSLKLLIGLPTCTTHSGLKWIRLRNPLQRALWGGELIMLYPSADRSKYVLCAPLPNPFLHSPLQGQKGLIDSFNLMFALLPKSKGRNTNSFWWTTKNTLLHKSLAALTKIIMILKFCI